MPVKQRILVPLDGSVLAAAALPYAEALARALGGTLHLLAVVEQDPPRIFSLDHEIRSQLELEQTQEMTTYLATATRGCRERGVDADTETVVGQPAAEILAATARTTASMIVMATHGRGGLQRVFLGSVADEVMRTASRPTLLISPREQHPAAESHQPVTLSRIALPLDGSPLAEVALGFAGMLAAAAAAKLLLVHVQSPPLMRSTLGYAYIPDLGAIEAGIEHAARQYLERLLPRLPAGVATETAVLRGGVPVFALTEYFEVNAVDLVVMSTHGHGGFHRLLLGSTADRLVRLGFPVLLLHAVESEA